MLTRDTGAVTFSTTELFLERLGLSSLSDLPDIAPLLPDVDVIDDLSETLDSEPRFMKLNSARVRMCRRRSIWMRADMREPQAPRECDCKRCCRRPGLHRGAWPSG